MIIYAVLGSAPKHMGVPVVDAEVTQGLVSFYDHPKAFSSLHQLTADILEKLNDRKTNPQP